MTNLSEVLDDLCSRFILNMPEDELVSFDRLFFQVEQAHWFYLDFYRENDNTLPTLNLKNFGVQIFTHVPFLQHHLNGYNGKFDNWKTYKLKVPVYGAIMLNSTGDKAVLVKGWTQRSTWGFPKGKVNKDEQGIDCAIREVYEETGYDFTARASPNNLVQINMHGHAITLYIVIDVPEETYFQPRTRKEISRVEWMKISDLPTHKEASLDKRNQFFMVIPFVRSLRQWLKKNKNLFAESKNKGGKNLKETNSVEASSSSTNNHHNTADLSADLRRMLGLGALPSTTLAEVTPRISQTQIDIVNDEGPTAPQSFAFDHTKIMEQVKFIFDDYVSAM
eukprot:CFRG5457T1